MTDGDGFPYFIDAVSQRSGLPAEQAAVLARAVLQTLAERVTGGAPDDLVGHLPNEVDGYLTRPGPGCGRDRPARPRMAGRGPSARIAGMPMAIDTGVGLDVGGAGRSDRRRRPARRSSFVGWDSAPGWTRPPPGPEPGPSSPPCGRR